MYTILNPHIIDFVAEPVLYKLAKRRPLKKYGYLISEAVKKYGHVNILVDHSTSGMVPMHIYRKLPRFARSIFSHIEIGWWKRRNKFGSEVRVHFSPKKMEDKEALIFFNYKHYKNPAVVAATCSHFKSCIAHLSHYHNDTSLQSNALKAIPNIRLAADVDISGNEYFKKFFPWYNRGIFILPFAVEDRFKANVPWQQRTDRILSVGTFHYCKEDYLEGRSPELKDFYETSHAAAIHPLRREIFERKEELKDRIDCMNSPYMESKSGKSFWKMIVPKNIFAGQKKYFSFNIVDKFNEYKFVVVGEELITGLPGIGTFEALACGCVVIGDKSAYGGQEHANLIQVDNNLTVDKVLDTAGRISSSDSYTSEYRNSDNFLLVEKQLNKIG